MTSYPDIEDNTRIGEQRLCSGKYKPGCRIFHVPREDSTKAAEIAIDEWKDADAGDAKNQVMVFKYKGKFAAVNHVRRVSYSFNCVLKRRWRFRERNGS